MYSAEIAESGWPNRTAAIVRIVLLIFVGVVITLVVLSNVYPGILSRPSTERQTHVITTLTDQIRQAYAPTLEAVQVRYGREGHVPTYYASFRLKGVPLVFRFTEADRLFNEDRSSSSLAYPELIGGPGRFVALAQTFHRDFPDRPTMSYQRSYAGNLPAPLPQAAEGMGSTVLVFPKDGVVDLAAVLAVYSWDPKARAWKLIHRGPLPEPASDMGQ